MTCKAACAAVQAGGGSITVPPGLKPGVFLGSTLGMAEAKP
jgi:hypothetical protein